MIMSLRATGAEVGRWARRLSACRSLWQQRRGGGGCPPQIVTAPVGGGSSSSRLVSSSSSSRWRNGPTAASIQYYSQGRTEDERLHEKEHLSLSPPTEALLPDGLLADRMFFSAQLRECSSPTDVLDLLLAATQQRHDGGAPVVPPGDLSQCLMRVWETTKALSQDETTKALSQERRHRDESRRLTLEHPGMEALLRRVMADAGCMSCVDVAYSLLAAVRLGVPQRSRVVHTLLRTCQEKLNEFDERSLSVLASSLEHLENRANITALKEGMRLKVDSDLPSIKTVMALQTMMRIVGKDPPLDLKKKLERKALSMKDQFTIPNCLYMISTMTALGFYSKPLLDICSKTIAENVHSIPFNRLILLLRSCRELNYRDTGLLTELSEHLASTVDMWSNKQLILFLLALEDLVFCPTALMEVFSHRVTRNPDVLTLRDLQSILKIYSSLNYPPHPHRQQFLDSLTRVLQSYLSQMSPHEVLMAVYFLCLLGHFPSTPLEHLLQSSVLEELSNTEERFLSPHRWMLQTVDRCLRLDGPPSSSSSSLAVPSSLLGPPVSPERCSPARPLLSESLQGVMAALPGASLQEAVLLHHFYMIDAVITTKPLGKAEHHPLGGSVRTAVMYTPSSAFCYGTSHPRAHLALKIRHLKKLGYSPLVMTEQQLGAMSQEEVAEFLRTQICSEHLQPAS